MGIFARLLRVLRGRTDDLLGSANDPRQVLDASYEKQLEMVQQAKRSVVEIATARRRLQLQAGRYREEAARFEDEARAALRDEREDLARHALERKQIATRQLRDLEERIAQIEQEERRLALAEQRLSATVESFRTRKELLSARQSAAEAQVRVGDITAGLSAEASEVERALREGEERTRYLEARAAAVDEMAAEGLLSGTAGDDRLEREIERLGLKEDVEGELAAMRRELDEPRPESRR